MWQIRVYVRRLPFGKVIEDWYSFDTHCTAGDLITKALGTQAVDKYDVYDGAL